MDTYLVYVNGDATEDVRTMGYPTAYNFREDITAIEIHERSMQAANAYVLVFLGLDVLFCTRKVG